MASALGSAPEQSLYAVLGLAEGSATPEEIRRAYRMQALQVHPDKRPPQERAVAEKLFKDISSAYEILQDPHRRREYDAEQRRQRGSSLASSCRKAQSEGRDPWSNGFADGPARPMSASDTSPAHHRPGKHDSDKQRMVNSRVWFAKGSACVGRAYKGLEAAEISKERQKALQAATAWASNDPATSFEIRGCAVQGEVHPRQRDALAVARCERTVEFLVSRCGLAPEQCHASACVGNNFQGVEVRVMTRIEVDGSFADEASVQLRDASAMQEVWSCLASQAGHPGRHVVVEVPHGDGGARDSGLARRRTATLRRGLEALGLPPSRCHARSRPGPGAASFFAYADFEAEREPCG